MKKRHTLKKLSSHIVRSKKVFIPSIIVGLLIGIPILSYLTFKIAYLNRVYPNVYVGSISMSGKSVVEAKASLNSALSQKKSQTITYTIPDLQKTITLGSVGTYATYDDTATVKKLMSYGRSGSIVTQIKDIVRLLKEPYSVSPVYAYNKDSLDSALANGVRPFERPVINSELQYSNGSVYLTSAQDGFISDRDSALKEFENYLAFSLNKPSFTLSIRTVKPDITPENSEDALIRAQTAVSHPISLKSPLVQGQVWTLDSQKMFSLLSLKKNGTRVTAVVEDYKVASYSADIATLVNKDPIDAQFEVDNGRAKTFEPATAGTKLDVEALTQEIEKAAFTSQVATEIQVPVKTTDPAISIDRVNDYGIKELVGQGKSKFAGSIPGRLHNIDLASSKLNGVLIAPDEVFSMYKYVGEVEKATGFEDAYIIKDGRTVPGTGGGLCQVSTTLFRAVLDAGLPVMERHEHAYRVHYYEEDSPVGIDAAVYFPSWDFKFKNTTGHYLLLQTKVDLKKMAAEFNLYGIKDGRKVEITKPVISSQTPPPPDLRQDDPTLARGQVKQVDWSAWGATVSFGRKVWDKDGNLVLNDTFKSNYRPWQAVYLVGTKDN